MSPAEIEAMTIENARALGQLTVIATQTTKDMDRMINNQEEMMPFATRISQSEENIGNLFKRVNAMVPAWVIKWLLGLMIFSNIYLHLTLQAVKENFAAHQMQDKKDKEADALKKQQIDQAISKQDNYQGRNYEKIESNKNRIGNLEKKPPILTQSYSITKE